MKWLTEHNLLICETVTVQANSNRNFAAFSFCVEYLEKHIPQRFVSDEKRIGDKVRYDISNIPRG